MDRHIVFCILIVLVSLSFMSSVDALGVTPGRTTLDFRPELEQTVQFSVINSEARDVNVVISVQGELKNYITIEQKEFSMSASEKEHRVSYRVKLPETLKPGLRSAEIVVLQLPDSAETSEAFVGAALAVITQLHIHVSYPGKYAEIDLNVIPAEPGAEVTFIIPVVSRGELDLASVRATIDIYTKLNEKVASVVSDAISVPSKSRGEIVTRWKADVPVGAYRAVATVVADGQTLTSERQFSIGSAVLDLQSVELKNDFALGEVAEFEMLVENKWSEPISEAYAQVHILDDGGNVLADFKSPTYDIPPLTKRAMTLYWDSAGFKVGTYDSVIYLKYGAVSLPREVQFKISDNDIEVIGLGYVISERRGGRGEGSSMLVSVLVIVVAVLVLLNLLWFLLLRKRLFAKTR